MAQRVKNLPVMQETGVQYLGQEDPLEKETATHSSILAWRIPWGLSYTVHGVAKSWTQLSDFHFKCFRLPCSPGERCSKPVRSEPLFPSLRVKPSAAEGL